MDVKLGDKFGNLSFIEEVSSHIKGHKVYRCMCDCGKEHLATRNNLLRGITSRCAACAQKSRISSNTFYDTKNNKYTYCSYRCMLTRCSEHVRYLNIQICDRWLDPDKGFTNFLEDMGPRPDNTTIDRIDNSKGYFKENCRWSDSTTQNHNKSKPKKSLSTSVFKGVSLIRGCWTVQFCFKGLKLRFRAKNETDAAVQYDNYSEEHYGDRPNGTIKREILPRIKKQGSINFDTKSNKFRVRVTVEGSRVCLGYFKNKEDASAALIEFLSK